MTQLSTEFPLQNDAVSDKAEEPVFHVETMQLARRPFMFLFRSAGWEPLCPDLINEVAVGIGRRD